MGPTRLKSPNAMNVDVDVGGHALGAGWSSEESLPCQLAGDMAMSSMSSEVRGLRSIVEMSLHGTREDAERSSTVRATGEAVTAECHVVQQSMMPQNEEAVELALMEEVEWRALETRRKMEEEEEFENCAEERGRRA